MNAQLLAAPAAPPVAVQPVTRATAIRRRPPGWVLLTALLLLVAGLAITALTVEADSGEDVLGLAGSVGRSLAHLRWQFVVVVAGLAASHYLATALAARAASGIGLPLGETLLVQLAAAAANRLTPAGLGGSALTARYFTRRGLDLPGALGAVSALSVLGAFADLLVLCVLVMGSRALGMGSGPRELAALTAHIRHLLGPARSPWLWLAVGVGVAAAGASWLARSRRRERVKANFWAPIRRLITRPRALATLVTASGATTLLLGIAFLACIAMVPGPHPAAAPAVVLVAFMLGSAAGSAVPVPAGLGSTEAALTAVLVGLGEPAGHAVQVVMIFRIVTFWMPAAVGIFATRSLHRRAAI